MSDFKSGTYPKSIFLRAGLLLLFTGIFCAIGNAQSDADKAAYRTGEMLGGLVARLVCFGIFALIVGVVVFLIVKFSRKKNK